VEFGASPRGSIYLVRAAQGLALIRGRGYVLPRDIAELAKDVIRHRLVMAYDALAESVTADDVLGAVLAAVPAPELELAQATGA
jgi:MoxR-like ATPase